MKKRISPTFLAYNALFGTVLARLMTSEPQWILTIILAFVALGFIPRDEPKGSLLAGVNKEIWTNIIKEGFYPDGSWLKELTDMTMWVEFNTINLAEAGVEPAVLVNNTSFPIATAPRTDTAIPIPLETYDTENVVVRNVEEIEASYDKTASVVSQGKNAMQLTLQKRGAYNIGPAANTATTPVFLTTGADDGTGRKRATGNDFLKLATAFHLQDFGPDRILLMHAKHLEDLTVDPNLGDFLKAQLISLKDFGVAQIYGFKVYNWSKMPAYVRATKAKKAYGAAVTSADSDVVSIVYLKSECMIADGTIELFLKEKDPDTRGDVFGFQKRAKIMPIRTKGQGALVSDAA